MIVEADEKNVDDIMEEERLSMLADKIMNQIQNECEKGNSENNETDFLKLQHVVDELVRLL